MNPERTGPAGRCSAAAGRAWGLEQWIAATRAASGAATCPRASMPAAQWCGRVSGGNRCRCGGRCGGRRGGRCGGRRGGCRTMGSVPTCATRPATESRSASQQRGDGPARQARLGRLCRLWASCPSSWPSARRRLAAGAAPRRPRRTAADRPREPRRRRLEWRADDGARTSGLARSSVPVSTWCDGWGSNPQPRPYKGPRSTD